MVLETVLNGCGNVMGIAQRHVAIHADVNFYCYAVAYAAGTKVVWLYNTSE